jgi:hypothetical protein
LSEEYSVDEESKKAEVLNIQEDLFQEGEMMEEQKE